MRKMINRICKFCNKKFKTRPDFIKAGWGKFCSMKCQRKGRIYLPNSGQFKKGYTAWNKGQHPKYMQKENHPNWKGGICIDRRGYIQIYSPNHPFVTKTGYVRKSHLIMEKHLGRYIQPNEIIHHINNNPCDDRLKNLKLFKNQSEHAKYHKLFLRYKSC